MAQQRIQGLLALALLLAACAADPVLPPRDCTPGTTSACVCLGAMTGVQTCTADGHVGACLCPDAGGSSDVVTVPDAAAADHVDVLIGTDPVPITFTDVLDAGIEDRPDVRALDAREVEPSDVLMGGDAMCRSPGVPIIRRCSSDSDCAACAPGVSGLTWCCRGTGYCENTRACESDAGRYVPDAQVECTGLIRCREHSDCQRLCLPRSTGMWCCTQGGECTSRELPTCEG